MSTLEQEQQKYDQINSGMTQSHVDDAQQHMYSDPRYQGVPRGVKFLIWVLFKVWRVDKGKAQIFSLMKGKMDQLPPQAKAAIHQSINKIPEPLKKLGSFWGWVLGMMLLVPYLIFFLVVIGFIAYAGYTLYQSGAIDQVQTLKEISLL